MNTWSIVVRFGTNNAPSVTQTPFAGGAIAPLQEMRKASDRREDQAAATRSRTKKN